MGCKKAEAEEGVIIIRERLFRIFVGLHFFKKNYDLNELLTRSRINMISDHIGIILYICATRASISSQRIRDFIQIQRKSEFQVVIRVIRNVRYCSLFKLIAYLINAIKTN